MKFQIQNNDPYSSARAGVLTTDHGEIRTPIFMPVGTVGSVKAVHFEELRRQVSAKSQENHQLLAELKNQMLELRRAVKSRYMQPDWIKYGVQDKR